MALNPMDLKNTFYQIGRSCFRREVRRVARGLARYCDLCCSNDSFVLFFLSKKGVQQQGDPAISESRIHSETAGSLLDLTAFFLDDGTVAGSHEATQAFLSVECALWARLAS